MDRCYRTADKANDRVDFLAACNTEPRSLERQSTTINTGTGCKRIIWARIKSRVRFALQTRELVMIGGVLDRHGTQAVPSGWNKEFLFTYFAETTLDLAEYVPLVASHDPYDTNNAFDMAPRDRPLRFSSRESTSSRSRSSSKHRRS